MCPHISVTGLWSMLSGLQGHVWSLSPRRSEERRHGFSSSTTNTPVKNYSQNSDDAKALPSIALDPAYFVPYLNPTQPCLPQ
jgi:hypothetical protein